jgi:hypothetical protein
MPRPGGRRQGQPGRSYSNRTDLAMARAPQQGTNTAAAGGYHPPAGTEASADRIAPQPTVTPDMVPKLDDPTATPGRPLTAGLMVGPGPGPEAMGPRPIAPDVMRVQAAYLNNPSPELRRTILWLYGQGAL